MTELKTLKDFTRLICTNHHYTAGSQNMAKELRKSAIKWIKIPFYDMPMFENNCSDSDWHTEAVLKEWIKHFFNITDEELK